MQGWSQLRSLSAHGWILQPRRLGAKNHQKDATCAMKKASYIVIIIGIIINHYKDPYWTTRKKESRRFFFVAHLYPGSLPPLQVEEASFQCYQHGPPNTQPGPVGGLSTWHQLLANVDPDNLTTPGQTVLQTLPTPTGQSPLPTVPYLVPKKKTS